MSLQTCAPVSKECKCCHRRNINMSVVVYSDPLQRFLRQGLVLGATPGAAIGSHVLNCWMWQWGDNPRRMRWFWTAVSPQTNLLNVKCQLSSYRIETHGSPQKRFSWIRAGGERGGALQKRSWKTCCDSFSRETWQTCIQLQNA